MSPKYLKLAKAIENAPIIPPCMNSDPEAWFPNMAQGRSAEIVNARNLCRVCPVQKECLEYALGDPDLHGIWGGTTPRERSKLRVRALG
jgi:WhiB family redox-sensing transcriptional regulator